MRTWERTDACDGLSVVSSWHGGREFDEHRACSCRSDVGGGGGLHSVAPGARRAGGADRGVRATATLLFPGNPAVLHSILTEYHKWPELFETKMRVAQVEEREGHVLTDVFISHPLLPGEQRLICDSQVLPGAGW